MVIIVGGFEEAFLDWLRSVDVHFFLLDVFGGCGLLGFWFFGCGFFGGGI